MIRSQETGGGRQEALPFPRAIRSSHVARRSSLVVFLLLAGCGYQLEGTQIHVPGNVHSVSVGAFKNESREFGLDRRLRFAFEKAIFRRGILKIVEDPGGGEAVLGGTIRAFSTYPVAFDADDEAVRYEAELTLDVTLQRQSDGEILWKASGLQAIEEYSVVQALVVPSSSQFQRGTLDLNDLAKLTDIQLAETEKRLAIDRLVGTIVTDVQDRILDDF
jgi:Lipopolysaccharide-assembly